LFDYLKKKGFKIDGEFEKAYKEAFETFEYQLVINPLTNAIEPLNPYPAKKSAKDYPFAGDMDLAEKQVRLSY